MTLAKHALDAQHRAFLGHRARLVGDARRRAVLDQRFQRQIFLWRHLELRLARRFARGGVGLLACLRALARRAPRHRQRPPARRAPHHARRQDGPRPPMGPRSDEPPAGA